MDKRNVLPKFALKARKKFLFELCTDKKVMHIGCTGGLLDDEAIKKYSNEFDQMKDTHSRLAAVAKEISGMDISEEKINVMREAGVPGNLIVMDITDHSQNVEEEYEVVVFANIIEHLDNVGAALKNCRKMMNDDSELIITTNNAFCIRTFIKMFFNYESVHIEHTAYYSYLTLKRVLEMNGLKIKEFYFSKNERTEFGNLVDRMTYYFGNFISSIFPQFGQDLIAVVVKDD
jgi:SAM-dependent methyltransferase